MGNKSYSKAISWFDDCRIPFEDTQNPATNPKYRLQGGYKLGEKGKISDGSITQFRSSLNETDVRGRFPANLLVSDDMLNDGKIYESGKGLPHHKRNKTLGEYQGNAYGKFNNVNPQINFENYYGDKGTNSRYYDIDKWFDNILNG